MFQKAKSVSLLVCKWGSLSPQPAACTFLGSEDLGCRRFGARGRLCGPVVVYLTVPGLELHRPQTALASKWAHYVGLQRLPHTERHTRKG